MTQTMITRTFAGLFATLFLQACSPSFCPPGFHELGERCLADDANAGRDAGADAVGDPSLASLVPSAGTLSPAFDGATTMYTLAVPATATSVSLTPTAADPAHATISVDGVTVASGASSPPVAPPFRPVLVTVTTDGGATRRYTVVVTGTSTGIRATYIKASNTGMGDTFGNAVALSSDGSTLAVGAIGQTSTARGAGDVHVFVRAGDTWSQQAHLEGSNTGAGDYFGYSVSLSADGATLAVGAWFEDSSATGIDGDQADDSAGDAGAVYVY